MKIIKLESTIHKRVREAVHIGNDDFLCPFCDMTLQKEWTDRCIHCDSKILSISCNYTIAELRALTHEWSQLSVETDTVSEFLDWLETKKI